MGIRSFLAFELPREMRDIVAGVAADARRSRLDARWVPVRNIHLTVVFLGDVRPESMAAVQKEVGAVCGASGPADAALKGIGVFPNRRNPHVLWLGLEGDFDEMGRLRDRLQEALAPFGIRQESRPFRPHLTLGRFRKALRDPAALEDFLSKHETVGSPRSPLGELVLFKSDLTPGGAVYTRMNGWPLGGPRDP